jgi:propionyl-CoA synthetase
MLQNAQLLHVIKGQIPLALVVIKLGTAMEHYQLEQEIIKLVRQNKR